MQSKHSEGIYLRKKYTHNETILTQGKQCCVFVIQTKERLGNSAVLKCSSLLHKSQLVILEIFWLSGKIQLLKRA